MCSYRRPRDLGPPVHLGAPRPQRLDVHADADAVAVGHADRRAHLVRLPRACAFDERATTLAPRHDVVLWTQRCNRLGRCVLFLLRSSLEPV